MVELCKTCGETICNSGICDCQEGELPEGFQVLQFAHTGKVQNAENFKPSDERFIQADFLGLIKTVPV